MLEFSITCRDLGAWRLEIVGLEGINFLIWYAMCSWKPLEGQGWSPDHPELIAPFPHSGLSCSSVNNKSMTVCAMYSIFVKYIQKIFEKRAGMEPETDLFDLYKASIVGTEVLVTDVTACIHL